MGALQKSSLRRTTESVICLRYCVQTRDNSVTPKNCLHTDTWGGDFSIVRTVTRRSWFVLIFPNSMILLSEQIGDFRYCDRFDRSYINTTPQLRVLETVSSDTSVLHERSRRYLMSQVSQLTQSLHRSSTFTLQLTAIGFHILCPSSILFSSSVR